MSTPQEGHVSRRAFFTEIKNRITAQQEDPGLVDIVTTPIPEHTFPNYDQDPTRTKINWPDPALGEGQQIEGTNFTLVDVDVAQGRTWMIDGGDAILPGSKDPKTGEDREFHSGEGEVSTLNMIIGSGVRMPVIVNTKGNFKGEVLNPNPKADLTEAQVEALLASQYGQVLANKPNVQTTQFVYVHLTPDGQTAFETIERDVPAMQEFIANVRNRMGDSYLPFI